ncbi:hypothetical protein ES706_02348 [subsurface metagenome]|nr:hypothetical protein [Dehalococcoidia bacterium]MQY56008.1 hypothetical protein [Dehalococcoidia bacterium]
MNYWLAVGPLGNWEAAFKHKNIWGLTVRQKHLWESLVQADTVLFYATQPISGVIGYGTVQTKFRQSEPLWPDEITQGKVIWPLRFEFNVEYCLPPNEWKTHAKTADVLKLKAGRGFQLVDDELARQVLSQFLPISELEEAERPLSLHEELKQKLIEIGKLQSYIAEPEYPFDIGKLDVVWRRIERSVPTYVFEIQVGGDLYHALAKLKHAFDLWNSRLFLVVSQENQEKARKLLLGSFHEISERIKFIELDKVDELYKRKRSYLDFERELGI